MPGKPSRRDRRRQGGNAEQRPRPAPAVPSRRIVRTPRSDAPGAAVVEQPEAQVLPEAPAPTVAPPATAVGRGRGPRAGAANALRRGATNSARALEIQREERVRRESLGDLRMIGVSAAITIVALGVAAVVL